MGKRATMADVARLAQVSAQTVSRVLSGSTGVRPQTRERILAAVKQLSYHPDLAAQMLASKQSRVIGVLMLGDLSYGRLAQYVTFETEIQRRGYFIISAIVDPAQPELVQNGLERLKLTNAACIIVMGQDLKSAERITRQLSIPTVVTTTGAQVLTSQSRVELDQNPAMESLFEHLYQQGCRRFVQVIPKVPDADALIRRRLFRDWCVGHAKAVHGWEVLVADWGCIDGAQAAETENPGDFDAVIAGNDYLAIGFASRWEELTGQKAGKDYALTGFDDIEQAAFHRPALTTIRQDFRLIGRALSDEVERLLKGEPPQVRQIPAPLVIRTSSQFRPTSANTS